VLPTRIETDFPEAVLNERYVGKCRAPGNPVPTLVIQPEGPQSDCPHTGHYNTSGYTAEAKIIISSFNNKCHVIHCGTRFLSITVSINVTTGKL